MDGEFDAKRSPTDQWVGEIADADGIDPRTIRSAGLVKVCTRLSDVAGVILPYRSPSLDCLTRAWPIPAAAAGLGSGGGKEGGVWPWLAVDGHRPQETPPRLARLHRHRLVALGGHSRRPETRSRVALVQAVLCSCCVHALKVSKARGNLDPYY